MNESFASWMIAGGRRGQAEERHLQHLAAIRASREAATDRPGLIDRVRARFGTPVASAVDGCVA
jgi:hypothetical protein